MTIKEVNSDLSGKYTCKVSNEMGAVQSSALLSVKR